MIVVQQGVYGTASCQVWFYGEYASALDTWGTWVGSAFF